MSYEFHHGSELLTLCSRYKISIGEVMLRREMEDTTRTREEIFAEMKLNLDVMRTSIRTGLDPTVPIPRPDGRERKRQAGPLCPEQ